MLMWSPVMVILCFVRRKLRPEKTLSASVLVAGTAKYFLASLARLGYLEEEEVEEGDKEGDKKEE